MFTGTLPEKVLLDVITHHLADIVIVSDATVDEPGPRMLYVNDRFSELSGYAADEVIGKSPRFMQGPATDRAALDRVRRAMLQGTPVTETVTNYARDGSPFELEMRIVPVVDRAGRPTHFVSIQRDVTREQQRRASRTRVELLLATVVNAVDFGMIVLDDNGICVLANRQSLAVLGKRAEEVIGHDLANLFFDSNRPSIDSVRTGEARVVQVTLHGGRQKLSLERLRGLPNVDRFAVLRVTASAPAAVNSQQEAGADGPRIVGGQLQLVGLDKVRKQLGDKWRERAEAVFGLAQGVLRRRLGARDVWKRSGDDGFIVAFADIDEATARFRATAIADEITQMLVGSGATDLGCTSRVAEITPELATEAAAIAEERAPEVSQTDLLSQIERTIERAAADLAQRLSQGLSAKLARPTVHIDRVRLLRANAVIAGRLRFDRSLESDLLAVRQSFDDAGEILLDAHSSLIGRAVELLSAANPVDTQPLMVPIDPTITDSRRAWTQLLDLSRRIPSVLRKRITPLIDGTKLEISPYRISDIANTLGQIFNRPALVHPSFGTLRFSPDRCRLRVAIFRGDELPPEGVNDKQFAKLYNEIRMTRVPMGIDDVRRYAPDSKAYPPHEVLIEPVA